MQVLYFLESIRNPVLDFLMALITHAGEEIIFLALAIFFIWCYDKYEGYLLLSVGFIGTIFNQFMKILCRIPRPWVLDPDFTIVESARAEATGYSFPSGHTQMSVGTYGTLARCHRQKVIRIVCIALCVLVPISRMYLGVHTPKDVLVSVAFALLLVFGLYPLVRYLQKDPKKMYWFFGAMIAVNLAFVLYLECTTFPADIDQGNLASAFKNAYTLLGSLLGLLLAFFIDNRFLHYRTEGNIITQIIKLVPGLLIVVGLKALLKAPLVALFDGHAVQNAVRYFLMVAFAGCLWPMAFPFFNKLGDNLMKRIKKEA